MTPGIARRAFVFGLGLAAPALVCLGTAGCGGAATETSDATVVPDPSVSAPSAGKADAAGGATAAAPASTSAAPAKGEAPASTSAAPAKGEGWGTLKGQVVFGGDPPPVETLEEKGKAEKDPQYCAKDAPIKSERLLVNKDGKGVRNVLVFLPKPTAVNDEAKAARGSTDVVFDQVKCVFEPHVLGVMAGSKVTLKSSDEVNHNVNAKLQKNSPFNSVLGAGQTAQVQPTTGERAPVPVTCDIHPWMQAWWLVLDNPYFAVTDDKGNFEIKNVPAGTQKVVVWQEATKFVTAPSGDDVAIKANETTDKNWTIDPGKVKSAR